MTDRRVHSFGDNAEVVRYDKAGKWFIEPKFGAGPRQCVSVKEAAEYAKFLWYHDNGSVNFDLPGGSTFDRILRS